MPRMPVRAFAPLLLSLLAAFLGAGCASNPSASGNRPAAATPTASTEKPAEKAPESRPSEPVKTVAQRKAEAELARGVGAYDNGDYKAAGQSLQLALDQGLASKLDQAKAYKYLAFIACAGNQIDVCKAQFRKALAASPRLALSKAEAGHPVWGPAFKEVKAEKLQRPKPQEAADSTKSSK